jgi:hypothetical protein
MTPAEIVALRARIGALAELLGPDELAVLEMVAQGLARGRAVYGELDVVRDRRDFRAEAGEELRDAMVYLGSELIRMHRRGVDRR